MIGIDFVKKVSILGDPLVGKTSLQRNYMGKGFSEDYLPTLGVNFTYKDVSGIFGKTIRLSIMDMAGHKNFANVRERYFKGTAGVLLLFDVTSPLDENKQILPWIDELLNFTDRKGIPVTIIGNKVDLVFFRQIHHYQGVNVAIQSKIKLNKSYEVNYFETSAKTGKGVDDAFRWLAEEIVRKELVCFN